jgi:peptidoglycan/LPS O-acetylase OafA/YrhL
MLPLLASSRRLARFAAVAAMMAAFFAFPNQHLVFSRLPIFLVGVFVFQYRSRLIALYEMLGLILAMVVAMFWPIGWIVASVSVATGLIIALSTFHSRAADFVGDISYSLYLLHLPIGVSVIGCLSHWLPYSSNYIGVLDVVGLAASGLAAWVMYQLIEKPSQVMSSSIRFARRGVEPMPAVVGAAASAD